MPKKTGKPRGFAAMSVEKRREIARKGGRSAQAKGTGHKINHEEAVAAGRKGGKSATQRGTAHRWTNEEAQAAAQKSGRRKGKKPSS
jgi:general stress protein YciG